MRLESNQTIDAHQQRVLNTKIVHWKQVIKRLVASVQILAQQSLAFRRHSTLSDKNNGYFLKLIEMLAKFEPAQQQHPNDTTYQTAIKMN